MSNDPNVSLKNDAPNEKGGLFGVIVHSFFVVPFLLAVLCVLFFAAVRILTMDRHTVYDYLADIKKGGMDKRWQAAFELSRMLSNPDTVPKDSRFISSMNDAYNASFRDDERVRQYLIMAMGRSGRKEFAGTLLKDIAKEKDENLYAMINALGILKSSQTSYVLLKYLDHENPRIRLAAVIALGQIGAPSTRGAIIKKLDDPEPNVRWDAAIALAKMGDKTARELLLQMLDRGYLKQFPNLSPENMSKIIMVTINATASWADPQFNARYETLFRQDPNMNIRSLAHTALRKIK